MDFSELDLSPEVLQAVSDAGYTNPTPIQEQAIPHVKRGRDVLGCAQTGTGKTASFVLPMVDMLAAGRARVRMPRSLILEPTRELATQVAASFELYGKHHRLTMALLIGGIEALGLIADKLELEGVFWDLVGKLNGGLAGFGYFVVGIFIASWILSYLIYRWRGFGRIVVERA